MRDLLVTTARNIWADRFRFGLTALGIVWGAMMLTYLSATADGYDRHFAVQLEKLGQRIVFLFPGVVTKRHVGQRAARPVELEREDVERLTALHAVERAAPNLWLGPRVMRAAGRTKLVYTYGGSDETAALRNFEVGHGRFISRRDVDLAANVVVLGSRAAERLFGGATAVGRSVHLEGVPFRVIGVARPKGDQLLFMGPPDDEIAYVPFTTARTWFTRSDVLDQVAFAPTTREGSWEAVRLVRAALGRHHGFRQHDDAAMGYFNVQEPVDIVEGLLLAMRLFLSAASLVTLVAGAIGVMNIMLVMVAERTREIGLKKAIGASNRRVFAEVVAETLLVTVLAGGAGIALGWLFVELSARAVAPGQTMQASPVLEPARVAVIFGTLVMVALASAVLPALRAVRTDAASALRAT